MKKMQAPTLNLILDYTLCGFLGFILRFLQDRKQQPRPDWIFQAFSSIAISYLAYVTFGFYKISIAPIEVWIMIWSWLGAFIVTTVDYIAKNGILIYLRKLAEDFLAFTKKK